MNNPFVTVQQAIAKDVLEKVQVAFPTATVCGGAPRDWFFGNPCSDIDIFFYDPFDCSWSARNRIEKATGIALKELGNGDFDEMVEEYPLGGELKHVWEGEYMGMTVQFMMMESKYTSDWLDYFHYDICKASWNGSYISPTGAFLAAHRRKDFGVEDLADKGKEKYMTKIMAKFPDYEYLGEQSRINRDAIYSDKYQLRNVDYVMNNHWRDRIVNADKIGAKAEPIILVGSNESPFYSEGAIVREAKPLSKCVTIDKWTAQF